MTTFSRAELEREFEAYVTGVASFGVFVTLKDYFVEGLVPISALGNDFFVYEERQHRLRGRTTGKTFRLGDEIRVRLVEIDEVRRRLNFRLGAEGAKPSRKPTPTEAAPAREFGRRPRIRKSSR